MTHSDLQPTTDVAPPSLTRLVRHSVAVIEANQAHTGAYLASPTFAVYRYSWLRDGAFIADAMSRAGRIESAEAFFRWCADVLVARAEKIEQQVRARRAGERVDHADLLHCRYTIDGAEAPAEWWNFQLDGYGTWLWALAEHHRRQRAPLDVYAAGAALCVEYLTAFWAEPSYDWWEENDGHQHTSTLAAINGGLRAAAGWDVLDDATRARAGRAAEEIGGEVRSRAIRDGRLTKWLDGDGIDASLVSCATPFRLFEPHDPVAVATIEAIERTLRRPGGGVHRHPDDSYFGGGEWLLLAALLGWYYAEVGRIEEARTQLDWVAAQATPSGDLPEQVDAHLLVPEARAGWEQRWGPVATPLLWSHAMLLTLAVELGVAGAPVEPS
jgi:GH15 family glucan-1,4-alpha-glucosidase